MPPFAKSLWLLLMLLAAVYVTALVTSIVVCVLVQRCIDCTGLYRDKYQVIRWKGIWLALFRLVLNRLVSYFAIWMI